MTIVIAHVGSIKESYFREAFAEYKKRLSPWADLEEIELRPAKTGGGALSPEEIASCLSGEAEEFEKLFARPRFARALRVALCVEGGEKSSEDFAAFFDRCRGGGVGTVLFLVGGSWGLDPRVKAACAERLSFSPMTFAHSLFSVMLAEQIYRAFTILSGGKYHK